MEKFSHIDEKGTVRMVDVTDKNVSNRTARAEGQIGLLPDTIAAITDNVLPKGNVLTTAKIAGIQAAKKTADLIPCLLYTSPSPRDATLSRMPSSA